MNRVMLIGRLTAKPELRYTGSNVPFARFSLAVNRAFAGANGQRETDSNGQRSDRAWRYRYIRISLGRYRRTT